MDVWGSKRTKPGRLDEPDLHYDVATSLLVTRTQDLDNIVTESQASMKAKALADGDAEAPSDLVQESKRKVAVLEQEHKDRR